MKLWSIEHVFKHPWSQTTEAVWKKYPNEQMPNICTIDVLDRKITADGKLLTTRLFGTHFNFPRLITALLGMPDMCYAIEFSEVDLKNKKMTLRMINYTFGSVLTVREKLVYQPSKEKTNETILKQSAKIQIKGIQFSSYFEEMLVSRFDATSKVGRGALENVLKKITVENILKTITDELKELTSDIDNAACKLHTEFAACKLNTEFNITERVQQIYEELDEATTMINTEIQLFSNKLCSEFLQLINTLNSELSTVVIKLKTSEHATDFEFSNIEFSNIGLTAAVKQAGITVKLEGS